MHIDNSLPAAGEMGRCGGTRSFLRYPSFVVAPSDGGIGEKTMLCHTDVRRKAHNLGLARQRGKSLHYRAKINSRPSFPR
jgi:hypothetical protein